MSNDGHPKPTATATTYLSDVYVHGLCLAEQLPSSHIYRPRSQWGLTDLLPAELLQEGCWGDVHIRVEFFQGDESRRGGEDVPDDGMC